MAFFYHLVFAYKFTKINYLMNKLKAISGCSYTLIYWLKIIINNKTTVTDISGDAYA